MEVVQVSAKKKPLKRAANLKKKEEDEGLKDYTHIFSSFYDIFVGN